MVPAITTADVLRDFIRDWIRQNPIKLEGMQNISIEAIDWFSLHNGKPMAEYSHRIKLSFGAQSDEDLAVRRVLCECLSNLVGELKPRCKHVLFVGPLSVRWDEKSRSFMGTTAIEI